MSKNVASFVVSVISSGLIGFSVPMFMAGLWLPGIMCVAIVGGIFAICLHAIISNEK